ncbi:MAG: zinc-ribbon domain-containing protein [Lachnospiraceae bacterium]|nr:zinc-ribbon domain-containing protein [Lachnospiraceae bacterium]
MFCRNCGTQLNDGAQFCTNCGNPIIKSSKPQASASQTTTPQQTVAAAQPAAPKIQPQAPQPIQQAPQPVQQAPQPVQQAPQPAMPQPQPQPAVQQTVQPTVPQQPVPRQPKKRHTLLIVLLSVFGTIVVGFIALLIIAGSGSDDEKADTSKGNKAVAEESDKNSGKKTKASSKAMQELVSILDEMEESASTWDENFDFDDEKKALAGTEAFMEELKDQNERIHQISGLPQNVLNASDDAYELYLTAVEDIHKNISFFYDLLDLYSTLDSDDMEESYYNFTDKYESMQCPDNLSESWKKIGRSADSYATAIIRSEEAGGLGDSLREYSAYNHITRFSIVLENEIDAIGDTIVEELDFATGQGEAADEIVKEIREVSALSESEIESHTFKHDHIGKMKDPTYDHIETIYPSLYNSYDSFVTVKMGCMQGSRNVIVECEIPGLSQNTSQSYTIGSALTVLNIKPPALTGNLNLDTAKDSQIKVTVKDKADGSVIDSQSFPVHINSRNDFELFSDEFGTITTDNLLCFLTPESAKVAELKRKAVDNLMEMTDDYMDSLAGYQGPYFAEEVDEWTAEYLTTYFQAAALMRAMSDEGVRYTMDVFSVDNAELQHILLPDQVIERKTGVCIETSLLIASALQSMGMHTFLVLPPGHAQVAVETWEGSGEYLLIETTAIPNTDDDFFDEAIYYYSGDADPDGMPISFYSNEYWAEYLSNPWEDATDDTEENDCYVIDCADGAMLGLTPFDY